MDLRKLIAERIKAKGASPFWLTDVYLHLLDQGAPPDDAIKALSLFVDEVIAKKAAGKLEKEVQ